MENTIIDFKEGTRQIEVFLAISSPIAEIPELISLACNYNANYKYVEDRFLFQVECSTLSDAEKLYRDYKEYFFSK